MAAPGPEMLSTAQCLYGLHKELGMFTDVPVLDRSLAEYEAVHAEAPAESNHRFAILISDAFTGASNVATSYRPNLATPLHLLTSTAIRAAQNAGTPKFQPLSQRLCPAAELKVESSIMRNQADRTSSRGSIAAVLFDVDGEAFAYRKATGTPISLAWREATMRTISGDKVIPAGSFFSFGYGERGTMSLEQVVGNLGQCLVRLEDAEPPTDVKLNRFSAFLVARELAECAYENATGPEAYSSLKCYVPTVLDLGLEGIAAQVQALLHKGRARRVKLQPVVA